MRKYLEKLFHIDHLMVTLMTFAIIAAFYAFFTSVNISFLNPVKQAVANFSLSDVYYEIKAGTQEPRLSPDIVLVDVTDLHSRGQIADVIDSVAVCNPKVLGFDLVFESPRDDAGENAKLAAATERVAHLSRFACKLTDYAAADSSFQQKVCSFFSPESPYFNDSTAEVALPLFEGYANVLSDEGYSYIRELSVERKFRGDEMPSLAAALAEAYIDTSLVGRRDRVIDFQPTGFVRVPHDSISAYRGLIEGRIVLLGTLGEEADMHYTPLGKMSGMEIQAYATQTLVDNTHIRELGAGWTFLVAFIVTYLTQLIQFCFVSYTKRKRGPFFHFISGSRVFLRLFTFGWMGVLTWISFLLYMSQDIYVSMALTLFCVALTGEGRGIYIATVNTLANYYGNRFCKKSLYYVPDPRCAEDKVEWEKELAAKAANRPMARAARQRMAQRAQEGTDRARKAVPGDASAAGPDAAAVDASDFADASDDGGGDDGFSAL